jgi:hypothetical protein
MSRVFSISLNDLTFAKLGELQKKYPDMSRNAMINHIINVVHSGETNELEEMEKYYKGVIKAMANVYDKDVKQR